ncbi:MAG TPA: TetR/AcrR family transcriptional regulator [Casimicrobiaceae bacterium]|nr:TetR/AcrR family transcriptional regulator [Casimicrobiaceae bacterium]
MGRPSRNVDAALLRAGRALYPSTGIRALSVRRVCERAGVNLAMFHYHFESKERFVAVLLAQMYEAMFERLTLAADGDVPLAALRRALLVLAHFARDHRAVLRRILLDALAGERVAIAFARANLPRHLRVVAGLVRAAQSARTLRDVAPLQALALLGGAIGGPILLGTAVTESGAVPPAVRLAFAREVLDDDALSERVDLVLATLAAPKARKRTSR